MLLKPYPCIASCFYPVSTTVPWRLGHGQLVSLFTATLLITVPRHRKYEGELLLLRPLSLISFYTRSILALCMLDSIFYNHHLVVLVFTCSWLNYLCDLPRHSIPLYLGIWMQDPRAQNKQTDWYFGYSLLFSQNTQDLLTAVTLCNTPGKGTSQWQASKAATLGSYPQEVHGRDHPKGFGTTCVPALLFLTAFTAKNKEWSFLFES